MLEPVQADPTWYEEQGYEARALIRGMPPAPCDTCPMAKNCAAERLACQAFAEYRTYGKWKAEPANPSREGFDFIENECGGPAPWTARKPKPEKKARAAKGYAVHIGPRGTSYQANVSYHGRSVALGSFKTAEEARAAYLAAKERIADGLPPKAELEVNGSDELEFTPIRKRNKPERVSKQAGVMWNRAEQKWRVGFMRGGKWYGFGYYVDEQEAIEVAKNVIADLPPSMKGKTRLGTGKGVSKRPSGRRWQAEVYFQGRNISLGEYGSEEAAHEAYLAAVARIREGMHPKQEVAA